MAKTIEDKVCAWKEIRIFTTTQGIDIVSGYLIGQGIRGVVVEDALDFDEFLENTEIHWDYIEEDLMKERKDKESNVTFYLPDNIQGIELFLTIKRQLPKLRHSNMGVDLGRLFVETEEVFEEDWATAWKKYYHPVKVGKNLVVTPCWENYQKNDEHDGEVVVTLDPGMAFGTGTHETTRLCMALLESVVTPKTTLLDIGTGSGILAITALLLGAEHATGVDIDELSVKVAGENADLNGVLPKLDLYCGDLVEKIHGKFLVVCANIVADVIIRLSENVRDYMEENGTLLVSGIIDTRCDEVLHVLEDKGFALVEMKKENGWVAMRFN